jgi:hypothetical protein
MKQIREQVKQEDVDVKSKSSHHSQTDAAKGFGGKYGVMKERQDRVCSCTIVIIHTLVFVYAQYTKLVSSRIVLYA